MFISHRARRTILGQFTLLSAGIIIVMLSSTVVHAGKKTCATLTTKGEKMLSDGRYRGAQATLEKAVQLCREQKPLKDARAFVALGKVHLVLERYKEAVPFFMEALRIRENLPLAHIHLSACYRELGQFDKAFSHGMAGGETENKTWEFMATYNLAMAHFLQAKQTKNHEDLSAEPYFKKALVLQPQHADSYFYLGMMEQYMKGNSKEAKTLFAKACDNGHAGACTQAEKL